MNKRTLFILSAIILLLLIVGLFAYFKSENYSWYKSYSHEQKEPYDLLLFENLCKRIDKNGSVDEVKIPFSIFQKNILKSDEKTNNLFLHIGNFKSFDYENADSLVSFIRDGNSAIIFEEYGNFHTIINQLNGFQKTSYQIYNSNEYETDDAIVPAAIDSIAVSDTSQISLDTAITITDEEYTDEASVSDSSVVHTDSTVSETEAVVPAAPPYLESSQEDTGYYLNSAQYTTEKRASCISLDFTKLGLKPNGKIENCYYIDFKKDTTEYAYFNDSLLNINHSGKKFDALEKLGFWNNKPVLIKYKVGKGAIYLCSQPILLSNYFLKENQGLAFFNALFKDFNKPNLYYNNYTHYNKNDKNNKNFTPLKYILSQPALKWAFYIFLALLICFFLFFSKRRQKIIPVLPLKENSTIEYVETISRLYQSRKAHRDVLEIMSKNFLKFIYHTYSIRFKQYDADFETKLSKISGIEPEQIKSIFEDIDNYVNQRSTVSSQQLSEFYYKIKKFYNNCK